MADQSRKDSTNDLPMYDIEEALKLVTTIHEKALETAAMPDVAKGCGYANPTSTPFYRRIVAARLFRFLTSPKAELTKLASDYLKPDTEDAKQQSLIKAVMGIKAYAEIIEQHIGKRINGDLVANRFEKDTTLLISATCAKVCAAVFVSSLKFAGFISHDGTVSIPGGGLPPIKTTPQVPPEIPKQQFYGGGPHSLLAPDGYHLYELPLSNGRKVTISAPLDIAPSEIRRLQRWIEFTLQLDWSDENMKTSITT